MEFYLLAPILFVLLTSWIFIKKSKNNYIALKYNYRIYALRDKLRATVISGNIKKSNWAFNFLDHSMSKLIGGLESMTIYKALLLILIHKNDKEFIEVKNKVNKEIKKNTFLNEIYSEYTYIILDYLNEKHLREVQIMKILLNLLCQTLKIKKTVAELSNIGTLPETSVYAWAK